MKNPLKAKDPKQEALVATQQREEAARAALAIERKELDELYELYQGPGDPGEEKLQELLRDRIAELNDRLRIPCSHFKRSVYELYCSMLTLETILVRSRTKAELSSS
ncbi:MAG: hypothetical protein Q8P45_00730 [Candidatus Harrisonbacteria bacterium]|nr:hypothetical protein [Candidatus Harrisonbacteria bacterium]